MERAARAIRRMLAGHHDSTPLSECGDWAQVIEAIRDGFNKGGGAKGAQKVFTALCAANPELIKLVAIDSQQERKVVWTVEELFDHDFPALRWAVPYMVPEGLSILAGRPKMGKSWLALQMAAAVGTGGEVLGEQCEQGKVLYFALEDSPRRLKERMVLQETPRCANIEFHISWPSLAKGGTEALVAKMLEGYRLIVIDTLSRAVGGADQMRQEAMTLALGRIQELALQHNTAVMMIDHHSKGAAMVADPIDAILGATSKAAVIDAGLGLFKDKGNITLKITGRDFEARELALQWDKEFFKWQNLGDAAIVSRGAVQQQIISTLAQFEELTATELASYLEKDLSNIRKEVLSLIKDDLVQKAKKRGREQPYQLTVKGKGENHYQNAP